MAPEELDELLLELDEELLELLVAELAGLLDLPLPQPTDSARPARPAVINKILIISISPRWFHQQSKTHRFLCPDRCR